MKKVYEKLLNTVNEEQMSKDGKYLTYYESVKELGLDLSMEGEELEEYMAHVYSLAELPQSDFITLETGGQDSGYLFQSDIDHAGQVTDDAYSDIMEFMKSEQAYKKYLQEEVK